MENFYLQPEGPGSHIRDRLDHPVVHISHEDAVAFCRHHGKVLPSEVQWEAAARGSLSSKFIGNSRASSKSASHSLGSNYTAEEVSMRKFVFFAWI